MNNLNKKRILWMIDETIANSSPNNWQRVRRLEEDLVDMIGNDSFKHEIVDPVLCLHEISKQLKGKEFSCVLDLTGWLTPAMSELFPGTPIESQFSMSRVRVVSSAKLETTGYKISMSPEEINNVKKDLDLSHPLIVDDVSFSGWTSKKTMDIWGLSPEQTTHAFLIANTGDLGLEPGAVSRLQFLGSKVVFGYEIKTPNDDGWHLKDLHQNSNLEQAFVLALSLQESIKRDGLESDSVQNFLSNESTIKTIFPDHITSTEINELMKEEKFILRNENMISRGEIHAKNPFLWASPYFQEHIDIDRIFSNKDHILSLLGELREITSDPEGKIEASFELQKEIKNIQPNPPEGQFTQRRERL